MKPTFKRAVFAMAFVASFLMFAAVPGQTQIYFQSVDPIGSYASQNDTNGRGLFAQALENFNLGGTAYDLTSIKWVGSYFSPPQPGVITAWTVQIYSDLGGHPEMLLYQTNVSGNGGETFFGFDNLNDPMYLYGVNLNFVTTANTTYWLSVYPDLGLPPQWGWETGTGGDGAAWACFFSACGPIPNDLAFALFGHAETTPEPGTLILLGSGILGVAGTLRRKNLP